MHAPDEEAMPYMLIALPCKLAIDAVAACLRTVPCWTTYVYVDTVQFRTVLIAPISGNGCHTHFFQIVGRIDLHFDDSMPPK